MIDLTAPAAESSAWLAVFGRFHILALHLPIGLVPGMAALEFGAALLRRPNPRGAVLTLAWFAALAAATAAASGLVLSGHGDYGPNLLGWHKICGIGLAVLCLLCAIAAGFARRGAFRVLLLLACAVAVPTGHFGGSLTHGADFLLAPLQPAAPAKPGGNGTPTPGGQPGDRPGNYVAKIAPLIEQKCAKCHNPDKKKGDLVLTTKDGLLAGGENGAVLVPGKPDDSPMLTNLLLPLDDDAHMPPEGKPQPTAEEIAALRAWIAAGAKFE